MKKFSVLIALVLITLATSFGQELNDSIVIEKVFGGYQFSQNEKILDFSQLSEKVKPNEFAFNEIKAAKSKTILATIIGGAGGFLVGYPLGTALAGGEPNWTMAAIGAGLIVVTIPIGQKANKQAKNAVEIYNSGLKNSAFRKKADINLAFTGNRNGMGLYLKF